jgi:hypothetical protein
MGRTDLTYHSRAKSMFLGKLLRLSILEENINIRHLWAILSAESTIISVLLSSLYRYLNYFEPLLSKIINQAFSILINTVYDKYNFLDSTCLWRATDLESPLPLNKKFTWQSQ